jgi:hypothetical protein
MAKTRKDQVNPNTIAKMRREGRGQGEHKGYKPWLCVPDVPSHGLCHRVFSWTSERVVHLFSNLELYFFYMKEWDADCLDFREQFPLVQEFTLEIARRQKVKHPQALPSAQSIGALTSKRKPLPIIMTTDCVITLPKITSKRREHAYSIKPKSKLSGNGSKRVREKLRIEEEYWRDWHDTPWTLITEDQLNVVLAKNVQSVHSAYFIDRYASISQTTIDSANAWLLPKIHDKETLVRLAARCDSELNLPVGASLVIARHLIARKATGWRIDFNVPFSPCYRLNFLAEPQAASSLV